MWVPAVRVFSVRAVSVAVVWEPEPCLNTWTPSIDIDDTSSVVVKKLKSLVDATVTVVDHEASNDDEMPGIGETPLASERLRLASHWIA